MLDRVQALVREARESLDQDRIYNRYALEKLIEAVELLAQAEDKHEHGQPDRSGGAGG
jgi:hypothetical protein